MIYTPGHILTYEVYSAFVYDNRHILNSFNFSDKEDYAAFLQQTLKPNSMTKQVREGISVTTNARIMRPAYKAVCPVTGYMPVGERNE